jgi:hypothetical protein
MSIAYGETQGNESKRKRFGVFFFVQEDFSTPSPSLPLDSIRSIYTTDHTVNDCDVHR